jgi:hypothetical protein
MALKDCAQLRGFAALLIFGVLPAREQKSNTIPAVEIKAFR